MAETSYQRLEVLSFCDRQKAKPLSLKITVLQTLFVKQSTMKISLGAYFWRIRYKTLVLKSLGFFYRHFFGRKLYF